MDAFDDAIARSLERTAVVRITLTESPVGKRKQYDKQGEEMTWGRMELTEQREPSCLHEWPSRDGRRQGQ
jgi:hypothetical protein